VCNLTTGAGVMRLDVGFGGLMYRCATWKVILCIADVESATGGKA